MRLLDIQEQLCAKLPTHRVTSFGQVSWFPAAYVSYNGVSVAINLRKLLISWRKLLTIGLLLLSQISGYRGILLGLLNRLPFDSCHGSMKFLSWSLAFQSNFLGVMRSRTRKLGHAHESWVMRKKFGSRARNLGHARESWVTHEKVGSRTRKLGHARKSSVTHEKVRSRTRKLGHAREIYARWSSLGWIIQAVEQRGGVGFYQRLSLPCPVPRWSCSQKSANAAKVRLCPARLFRTCLGGLFLSTVVGDHWSVRIPTSEMAAVMKWGYVVIPRISKLNPLNAVCAKLFGPAR